MRLWGTGPTKHCSVQFSCSVVSDSATSWTAVCWASLFITNSQSLLKLMSIESVMSSNHLILCCPLLLPLSIFPGIRVFSNESVLWIRWPKYWSFSFSISPSNEYPDWFPLGWTGWISLQSKALKSLLQHHSSKASILLHSAFFIVQLSHLYMTTGKTKALTRWMFVGKVMSLLFNLLSRLVITFLPRSKWLLISRLQSPSAVIWWDANRCNPKGQELGKIKHTYLWPNISLLEIYSKFTLAKMQNDVGTGISIAAWSMEHSIQLLRRQ